MRMLRRLLIVLAVVAVVLVAADRVGAWAAQRMLADQVEQELASREIDSAPPEVTVDRVPFLTQVAAGRYASVTVRLRDVGTGEVRLPLVQLTATGVDAPLGAVLGGDGKIVADQVAGEATVGYDEVLDVAGLPDLDVSGGANGQLRVGVPTELLGTPVTVTGTAEPIVVDGAVQLQVRDLAVAGQAPPPGAEQLLSDLGEQLSVTVPLPPLPYGVTVDSVQVASAGLVVGVSADDVPLG